VLAAQRPFYRGVALVEVRELVTAFFERLGNAGVLLLAGALLAGGLAGAAVAHHYDRLTANTSVSEPRKGKAEQKTPKKKDKHAKQKQGPKQHQQDEEDSD